MSQPPSDDMDIVDDSTGSKSNDSSILVVDNLEPTAVIENILAGTVRHVIQKSGAGPAAELEAAQLISRNPQAFLQLPFASLLAPKTASHVTESNVRLITTEFCTPFEKDDVLEAVGEKLYGKVNSGLVSDVLLIADELYTNAILNAPFKTWEQELGGTHRKLDMFHNLKVKPAEIIVGLDSDRIIVGCIDQYGSLDPIKLLSRIKKVLHDGLGNSLNFGPTGGAGIGSTMIFSTCTSLYFGVVKNARTIVCAGLPINSSRKTRALMPKNLHVAIRDQSWS